MKFPISSALRLVTLAAAVLGLNLRAADDNSPREHLLLDANWKFHLGDDWPNALRLDKAGTSGGPAAEKFNDNAWRSLDLPHDWAIELPFEKNANMSHGFKPVGPGYPQNNVGWYRRTIELPAADAGKRLWLTFDGAFRDTTVWVNGWLVARHEGGYYPFREDITDIAHFGGKNTIAVRVDATKFEGWFYEGAGIYRHVWLDKTAPVAIAPDGIFVYPRRFGKPISEAADVRMITKLVNAGDQFSRATLKTKIIAPNGDSIGEWNQEVTLSPRADREIWAHAIFTKPEADVSAFDLSDLSFTNSPVPVMVLKPDHRVPELWTPESPKLYKLVSTVSVDGKVVDQKETEFGIRTFAFDPTNGFLLNGKHYELYGTCNHQDMAGVGAALPDALQYFRIAKLKEFGCNAYRTSHNPPTPELLDACDHLGMIIMDESRLLGSDRENLQKLDDQIRRDRNHACVGIWSIANEEFFVQDTPQGAAVARTMQDYVKRLDPTRPVTYAAPEGDTFAGINGVIDVRGWNYHPGPDMDTYHAKHPDQPEVGTEQASTVSTRGIYENDKVRGYVSAYDVNHTEWSQTAEAWWSLFADRPWLSGGFVWTGFDYRGEPTPYGWPCINSHFGVLDMCGFPKDNFYYYQSWWTTNIVLHLLPHWNWPGKEGREIRVDALSNCKQVELFLNGQSLGKQAMQPNSKLSWQVKYAPGTLSAKGFDDAGKVIAETKVETTGDAAAVRLTPNRTTINADGEDVSVITVSVTDAQGRIVPVAGNKIYFAIEGAGKILGVGNGDPSCHEPDKFVPESAAKVVSLNDWRWMVASNVQSSDLAEYAADFDDSAWEKASSENDSSQLTEGQCAVFRQRFNLAAADLASPEIQIQFGRIDDLGWIYVNGKLAGESRDWSASPAFDLKKFLHEGDNTIAVGVQNVASSGGLGLGVYLQIAGRPAATVWSRSVFNGLAQIMVQSTQDAGEIKLTATAEGLKPATTIVTTQPATPRPRVP